VFRIGAVRNPRRWAIGGLVAAACAASLGAQRIDVDLQRPLSVKGASYVGSDACGQCHPAHYRSWHRTFHRTMTQEASDSAVLGDFARGHFEYGGVHATMRRDGAGRPVMEFARRGGLERWSALVERTVGSRRYQQYLARDGDVYYRLPLAWNIEDRRWMHMNGAFLTPDPDELGAGAAIDRADYDRHVARWNDNCVYCHNVAPKPGLDPATGRFATEVAELGIACEACHGPAAQHSAHNRDPLRRFVLHVSAASDPTIANPARLTAQRSAQVCGRCHGQRISDDITHVHRTGDNFVPGEDLAAYSEPLWRDSALNGERRVFESRFWPDGTARLTAYEYQGLLQSPCAQRGALTCTTCHGMHEGDPRGQLRPARTGDAMCTGCHGDLASATQQASHTRHSAQSAGARCINCHMPRIVYGLVGAHRSHRIDSPQPSIDADESHPDACTLCHTDRSRAWADAVWRGERSAEPDAGALAESTRLLLAGDPIERALAAAALGREELGAGHGKPESRLGLLADTLLHDPYPAVRAIAWRSLRELLRAHHPSSPVAATAFTATDPPAAREHSVNAVLARLPPHAVQRPDPDTAALRSRAPDVRIAIGE
jgi:predicted CXXCH cytochrome family protein